MGAMPVSFHQEIFDKVLQKCNVSSGQSGLHHLQSIAVQELIDATELGFWYPTIDDDWITGRTMTDLMSHPTNVEMLVGSCSFEVTKDLHATTRG